MTSVPPSAVTRSDLFDLAFSDQRGRIGSCDLLGDLPHDLGPGGVGEPGQFTQMLVNLRGIGGAFARCANQQRALHRGGDGDQFTDCNAPLGPVLGI